MLEVKITWETCKDLLYVRHYAVCINISVATRKRLGWDNLKILPEVNVQKHIRISNKKKPNLIIVFQQDATVFILLHFCRQLYAFRVLTPIIRSWYSCNYNFWYWLIGSTTIRSRCWVGTTQQRERMVANPVDRCQKL